VHKNFIKIGYNAWVEFRVYKMYTETFPLVCPFSSLRQKKGGGKEMVSHLCSSYKLRSGKNAV
jgi:hypothetical protein